MNYKKVLIIIGVFALAIGLFVYLYNNSNKEATWDQTETNYIHLSTLTYEGNGVDISNNNITIEYGGIYEIDGNCDDCNITINTVDKMKVNLILNNINLTSSTIAINIINGKTIFELIGDNSITDGTSSRTESTNGAIFSKDDLVFIGDGTLNVTSNYSDAIVTKDNLTIESGTYNIKSVDDGIRGKDYIYIKDGTFTIDAQSDALKSTNTEDDNMGYITIENGTFNITTGNGSSQSFTNASSAKGIKANNITIENGTFIFNTLDDAIHSNDVLVINDGTYSIKSGDDGIHADTSITINNGTFDILNSYEGIESANITINNGTINILASDDGINVAGGNDQSSMGRPGQNNMNYSNSQYLTINGGTIYVNATGDGLDANGSIYINGGIVTVDGPTNDGNGALDYDNELLMNGGTLISSGSSGMLQSPSTNSTLYSLAIIFNNTVNSKITIKNNDDTILEFTPNKNSKSLVYSSALLKLNETYIVYINGELYKEVTITSKVTSIGSNNGIVRR